MRELKDMLQGLMGLAFSIIGKLTIYYMVFLAAILASNFIFQTTSMNYSVDGLGVFGRTVIIYCLWLSSYHTIKTHRTEV